MTTRIKDEAIGLTIEYTAKRKGSVQFDSMAHPNRPAVFMVLIFSFVVDFP